MKKITFFLTALILVLNIASAQQSTDQQDAIKADSQFEFMYDVVIHHEPLSITKEVFTQASKVVDLNKHYKSSWVKEFVGVEVITINNGIVKKAMSSNDVLTEEQKRNMASADVGQTITVDVQYLPENKLLQNDVKEYKFTFRVRPNVTASYPGGDVALLDFVKKEAVDQMPEDLLGRYQMAAYNFTINEVGQVVDAHTSWSTKDEATDNNFLKMICNMPAWTPASYTDGTTISQNFVIVVGDKESCAINTFNLQ